MKIRRTWLPVFVTVAMLLAAGGAFAQDTRDFHLTILFTNDIHAHVLPFDSSGQACEGAPSPDCLGGAARRAGVIGRVRAEGGNVILLDAGDEFQGTLFFTRYKGGAIAPFMNMMAYDAMTLGNHEFDEGSDRLAEFIATLKFPVLGANVKPGLGSPLKGLIGPVAVVKRGGESIGIVGYTTQKVPDISNPGPDVRFRNIERSVETAIAGLRKLGVNKIVGLSHAGYRRDLKTASMVEGLDVIVGGHTHTLLSNTDPKAEGPYPTVVKSPSGKPVLVVTAGYWGRTLGRLDVTFDKRGRVTAWEGAPIPLDGKAPEDPAVLAKARELAEPLEAMRKLVVGRAEAAISIGGQACRFEECALGNLVADAMLAATRKDGARVALANGGGVRSGLPQGDVTLGMILEILPFSNTLSTFDIHGKDLRLALEHGVSSAVDTQSSGTGRFLQVAGLRYTWNPGKPAGSRIVDVEVQKADGSWEALRPGVLYKVVTNDFLRRGGDGFEILTRVVLNPYDYGQDLVGAVTEYIAAHSPINPKIEGRVRRVTAN